MEASQYNLISPEGKDLLKKIFTKKINKRLSAKECLDHPWFMDNSSKLKLNCTKTVITSALKKFISFNAKEKLQQATMAYIVHFVYCNKEINELKTVFKQLDTNADGKLTLNELKNGFEIYFGKILSNVELKQLMEDVDGDADGFISYEEFLRVTVNKRKLLEEKNLFMAFERFDVDGDGKLSKEEIKKVLYGSDLEYIDELIKEVDTNKDGYINYQEFKELMNGIKEEKGNEYNNEINEIDKTDDSERDNDLLFIKN
jgi:calcium-dependent protein kinase